MLILGSIFFVIVPTVLLLTLTRVGEVDAVAQLSQALEILPQAAQDEIKGDTDSGRSAYALAVYLFAPAAVGVPITTPPAVGAARPEERLVGKELVGECRFRCLPKHQ